MTRTRHDTATADLFDVPHPASALPGEANIGTPLRHLLSTVLAEASGSRFQIAARMSELLGTDISKFQLDSWTAESREGWRFPLEYLPALEVACETHAITRYIADLRGCRVLVGREALLAELGKWEQRRDQAGSYVKELRKRLGEGS